MRLTRLLLGALLVLAVTVPAVAQLYRWTDTEGVVRYTNDRAAIPPAHRNGATDIGSPAPRPAPSPGPALERGVMAPFTAGGPINVAASLNGAPLVLMVDTGADRTVVSPDALARAGLAPAPGRAVRVLGVAGSATAGEALVERLELAGARVGPLPVIVLDVGVAGVDGLLGRDVLDHFTLTVDAARGQATLAPR
ncbi:MAG TPA: retropepsin-like aspartic protease [Methylomirabilota bacterium]|nr:retropepsin-like aspartic protease [Methylomirabilota bacterium]